LLLFSCNNPKKMPYIIKNKKRIRYEFKGGKVIFSDGKIATPNTENVNVAVAWDLEDYPVDSTPPVVVTSPVTPPTYRLVGSGSGELQLGDMSGQFLKIKPGSYSSIKLGVANKCVLDCSGVVTKGMDINKFTGLEISGLSIINGTGIYIVNPSSGLRLLASSFENIQNNVIRLQNQAVWDGTDAAVCKDWLIQGCKFKNTESVFSCGSISDQIRGLCRNISFVGNTVKDLQINGSILFMGAVDGYLVESNIIDHVNYGFTDPKVPYGNHNGVFQMVGNGILRGNKATNCQGNLIRAWGISFGSTPKTTILERNVYVGTVKYGGFEIQCPPVLDAFIKASTGKYSYVNYVVRNNTAGNLGTANVLWAQMLDSYFTGGTVEYYDNLGWDMIRDDNQGAHHKDNITDMLVNFSGATLLRNSGNLYFPTQEEAVDAAYKSLQPGVGAY
jgi:hypothetical protein